LRVASKYQADKEAAEAAAGIPELEAMY
jgi:hypothetical protein